MTKQEVLNWAKENYDTDPEYLWEKYPEYAVLRNRDGKWYGIIMNVPKNKFGIQSNETVDVLNVKAEMFMIDTLVRDTGFYRAYHMNKNQWISIFLDGSVPAETVIMMLGESYLNTSKKKKKPRKEAGEDL